MKPIRTISISLALLALVGGAGVSNRAGGQAALPDDPFEKLKSYDFQSRGAVEAIRLMIDQALADKTPTTQIEEHLDAVLDDPSAQFAGKQEAARFLWVIGTARSVPSLTKLLADDKLADVARYALERNPDPAAANALRSALTTAKDKTLIGVINSLGNRMDPDAVAPLKPFVASTDDHVSQAAISALGKIGTDNALTVLRALPATNALAGHAMIRAAEHLAATGKKADAQRVYESLLGDARPTIVRAEAVRGLAAMQSPRAGAAALAALKSTDPYLQQVAAHVCGTLTDPKTTAQAIAAYPSLPVPTQIILLTTFADRHAAAATDIALSAINSPDPALRMTGIQTAALVGGTKAVPRLVDLAVSGMGQDKNTARASLASMPGADVEQALLNAARQGKPEVRSALMTVLAERPTPTVTAALLEGARGSDSGLAVEAIRALGRTGGAPEHAELVKLLVSTKSDEVRDASKDAVVSIGQRLSENDRSHAADPILAAYPTASTASKAALLSVLAEIGGDRALEELTKATVAAEPEVKQAAITALADSWPDARPLPTLLSIAKTESNQGLRVQALRGYLRLLNQDEQMLPTQKVALVGQALTIAERPEEKRQALGVLRDCRIPQAMELAGKLLDTPDLFSDASDTVLYLAAPQRKNNKNLPAVKGPATTAALTKVMELTKDDNQRTQAQKLK